MHSVPRQALSFKKKCVSSSDLSCLPASLILTDDHSCCISALWLSVKVRRGYTETLQAKRANLTEVSSSL